MTEKASSPLPPNCAIFPSSEMSIQAPWHRRHATLAPSWIMLRSSIFRTIYSISQMCAAIKQKVDNPCVLFSSKRNACRSISSYAHSRQYRTNELVPYCLIRLCFYIIFLFAAKSSCCKIKDDLETELH